MTASVFRPKESTEKKSEIKSAPSVFKTAVSSQQQKKGGNYEISDEDLERMGEKGQAEAMSRLIEGAVGLPGNIASLANKLTGGHVNLFSTLSDVLPTTEKIKEFSEKASQGYTKSEGKINEIAGEYLQDVGSYLPLAGVGFAAGTGGRAIDFLRTWQPFISPFLGQSMKQSAKAMSGGEGWQEGLKLAIQLTFDVLTNRGRGAQGYINHLFQEAEKAVPRGVRTNANQLRNSLTQLQVDLQRGGKSPDKTAALEKIKEVLDAMVQRSGNYFIDVAELPAFRRSINAVREQLGGWKSELPVGVKRRAIRNLENVKGHVIEAGMDYGRRVNPRFADYWSAANEAANTYGRSNVALRFLENTLGTKLFGKMMGGATAGHAGHAALTGKAVLPTLAKTAAIGGAGAAAGAAGYNFSKIVYRMARSPNLRNYYSHLFRSAIQQDSGQVAKYSDKIEKEEKKEEDRRKKLINSILKD